MRHARPLLLLAVALAPLLRTGVVGVDLIAPAILVLRHLPLALRSTVLLEDKVVRTLVWSAMADARRQGRLSNKLFRFGASTSARGRKSDAGAAPHRTSKQKLKQPRMCEGGRVCEGAERVQHVQRVQMHCQQCTVRVSECTEDQNSRRAAISQSPSPEGIGIGPAHATRQKVG